MTAVIDYVRVVVDDHRPGGPDRAPQHRYLGVGYDDALDSVGIGEVDFDGHTLRFVGRLDPIDTVTPEMMTKIGDLRKPDEFLVAGDAVMVKKADDTDLGRYDLLVDERRGDRLRVEDTWFDFDRASGKFVDPSGMTALESTTTISGEHPYADVNLELGAQLYMLRERVAEYNPHSPTMAPVIEAWNERRQWAYRGIRDAEPTHKGQQAHLVNTASDLQLVRAKLDSWLVESGAMRPPVAEVTAAHAEHIAEIKADAIQWEEGTPEFDDGWDRGIE